ncbi:4-hydroxy-tetrahydrodipicolinate reductase [Elizabethkingia argentiflava]|uniref:4-hydroxy-tetrahydrodipicolinate reductase n=1 Tax=Elizabethkingia argenteiflava TaxID=2681556 RepID=A0A845PXI1_9FLAO|nr:4-hydroxy-tetrahydrodipicolinate reductase [Elizabethkingia argenteiflava]NAW51048.1 4-hydroxy-tetrahydrodipicolinate reductase [Elizabethkingia argenteiflava]
MKIALVGYGKMGKIIDQIAQSRGHEIVARLAETPTVENLNNPDVVIEFSNPDAAYQNIKNCLELKIPVICGTTGWLEQRSEIEALAVRENTAFLYSSNFSLGINLFFALNKKLAQLMHPFSEEYRVQLEEIHHTHKKDAPSGTAISLAEGVIENSDFTSWKLEKTEGQGLGIFALRKDEVPGTHSVYYRSEVDEIEIKHTAFSRKGFASGAVMAAEWIKGKKGIFNMKDVFGV